VAGCVLQSDSSLTLSTRSPVSLLKTPRSSRFPTLPTSRAERTAPALSTQTGKVVAGASAIFKAHRVLPCKSCLASVPEPLCEFLALCECVFPEKCVALINFIAKKMFASGRVSAKASPPLPRSQRRFRERNRCVKFVMICGGFVAVSLAPRFFAQANRSKKPPSSNSDGSLEPAAAGSSKVSLPWQLEKLSPI